MTMDSSIVVLSHTHALGVSVTIACYHSVRYDCCTRDGAFQAQRT